jgi:hypothetical protein
MKKFIFILAALMLLQTIPAHAVGIIVGGGIGSDAMSNASGVSGWDATGIWSSTSIYTYGGGTMVSDGVFTANAGVIDNLGCASDFARVGLYCPRTAVPLSVLTVASGASCAQSTALSGVSDATAVDLQITSTVASTATLNALDSVSVAIAGPADSTCATRNLVVGHSVYEFVSTAATTIGSNTVIVRNVPSNASGQIYAKDLSSTAGSSTTILVVGYHNK